MKLSKKRRVSKKTFYIIFSFINKHTINQKKSSVTQDDPSDGLTQS